MKMGQKRNMTEAIWSLNNLHPKRLVARLVAAAGFIVILRKTFHNFLSLSIASALQWRAEDTILELRQGAHCKAVEHWTMIVFQTLTKIWYEKKSDWFFATYWTLFSIFWTFWKKFANLVASVLFCKNMCYCAWKKEMYK